MNTTTIEWTDFTWNPVTGCNKVSPGCRSCYAEQIAHRFWGDRKFTDVVCHHDRLAEPEKYRAKWHGKKVFVCSMSDLFHESVPFYFIREVWQIFATFPDTTFQVLTKRPERALEFFKWVAPVFFDKARQAKAAQLNLPTYLPLPNVWMGVSCENQEQSDKRVPALINIPSVVRFLSCEPMLGPIDICQSIRLAQHPNVIHTTFFDQQINWVIVGGESGHMARPMHPDWVRNIQRQCATANVPFLFKQWGAHLPLEIDAQPPFFTWSNTGESIDGHTINIVDPITAKAGRYQGRPFMDPFDSMLWCEENNVRECVFLMQGNKPKFAALLDGKEYKEFPQSK